MFRFLLFSFCVTLVFGKTSYLVKSSSNFRQDPYHRHNPTSRKFEKNTEEETAHFWRSQADDTLTERLKKVTNTNVAKNVILFMGDGMSIATLAAARTLLGQRNKQQGEDTQLSFEKFPYTGLSKTYCVDRQVADSACSATAYLCGVKANEATIGVTAAVKYLDCNEMVKEANHVHSIAHLSQLKGKRTGFVTTTRVTHASPSGVYAHTASRNWESDSEVIADKQDPKKCMDIAQQLVYGDTGKNLNVIFGGGRAGLIPKTEVDEEKLAGWRSDGRNLIKEWEEQKGNSKHQYIYNLTGLKALEGDTEYTLGLFANDHMDFNVDRDKNQKPSLEEMTVKAIELLSQGDKGFFLFVEGGRIDHAHHKTLAHKALDETIEFHKAIQAAVDKTDESDTLIVVTSDHSHTMTINGYPERGNDILGIGGMGDDKLPYTTLSYANGPGASLDGKRPDLAKEDLTNADFLYPSYVPISSETHGGEDVGIFAQGPWSHLFVGVTQQNVIHHLIKYASCVGEENEKCGRGGAQQKVISSVVFFLSLFAAVFAQQMC